MNTSNTDVVREATRSDFEQLMSLYRELQPADPVLTNGEDARIFQHILAQPGLLIYVLPVAEDEHERLVASCYLNVIPNLTRSASPYAIIENVITTATRRERGYGRQVVSHALQQAWDRGCYKVMLQTGSRREATHAFYRSCGFSGDDKFGYVARPPADGAP